FVTGGLRSALGAQVLDFLIALTGFGAGESGSLDFSPVSDKLIRNRHPKDFPFGSLSTELKISKNMFFIRQMKWRIWSRVELVLTFMDGLGEFFPDPLCIIDMGSIDDALKNLQHWSPWSFKP
nr:hypothetical protein [Tanacetum cinerariifolium]